MLYIFAVYNRNNMINEYPFIDFGNGLRVTGRKRIHLSVDEYAPKMKCIKIQSDLGSVCYIYINNN